MFVMMRGVLAAMGREWLSTLNIKDTRESMSANTGAGHGWLKAVRPVSSHRAALLMLDL